MNKDITEQMVHSLEKDGAQSVKSKIGNYTKPNPINFKWSKKSFTPDIVANYEGRKDIFSIESKLKKKDLPDLISKWILFGLTARKNGGQFYIVTKKEASKEIQKIIDNKKLSAELIYV